MSPRLRIDVQVEIAVTEYDNAGHGPATMISVPHAVVFHSFGLCEGRAEADTGHIADIARRTAELATERALIHPRRPTQTDLIENSRRTYLDRMARSLGLPAHLMIEHQLDPMKIARTPREDRP